METVKKTLYKTCLPGGEGNLSYSGGCYGYMGWVGTGHTTTRMTIRDGKIEIRYCALAAIG